MDAWQRAESRLNGLTQQGADRFDPVRFSYLAALVRGAEDKKPSVRRRLAEKALKSMDDYQKRLEAARNAAACQIERTAESDVERAEALKAPYERCDYRGVRRMGERFDRQAARPFLRLKEQMELSGHLAQANAAQFSMDALLRLQEEQIVKAVDGIGGDPQPLSFTTDTSLRAFHFFEASWAAHHAETVVSHAIGHLPENPGHLNSQMLVTRCLSAMRKLAPAYLRRWVGYMETLLWLEGAKGEDTSISSKGRGKT